MSESMSESMSETENKPETCAAVTRIKRGVQNHSVRCQHPPGHEGAHSHKKDSRETIWFGEVSQPDYSNRFRFGISASHHSGF